VINGSFPVLAKWQIIFISSKDE